MFYQGSYNLSVDGKGRIVIPVNYREHLQQQFDGKLVIGQTFQFPCLTIYPEPVYVRIREKLSKERNETIEFLNYMRTIVGFSHDCNMLANGRVLLPKHLREFYSIDKDAVLVGMGTRFELWDHKEFDNHNKKNVKSGNDEIYRKILQNMAI